ncbi:MAG: hypothetical protein ACRDM7_13190 [Thermoleophilaceae bacterium]
MPPTLTFLPWSRERIGDLAATTVSGRARGQTTVTLTGTDAGGTTTTSVTRTLAFLLAGPPDVAGLQPGAITARYPVPGTIDAESDKSSHVELAEPTLPWRYTPAGNPASGSGTLHPWLALVVGVEGDELTVAGDRVTLSPDVQLLHALGGASGGFQWAHVQVDAAGRRVARVLSGRPLDGGVDYLAVLVPAFAATGAFAWTGAAPVTLPVYDHWRFRTAIPPGGFRDLAEKLQPGEADPNTGRAPLDYPRVPAPGDLEVRGALAPINSSDAQLPSAVGTDLGGLLTQSHDPQGRPIVGLPLYGDAWHADPLSKTWGSALNRDPRHRGVAGLGLELGIRLQEELSAEAADHAGALGVAAQRVRDLVLGLAASSALWDRRLPNDPFRRLWVLGPALDRVVTDVGSLGELATADDRALPRGVFSSAARRALRPGPARTALLSGGPPDPRDVVIAANRCPAAPVAVSDGVELGVDADEFDKQRERGLAGELTLDPLAEQLEALDLSAIDPELRGHAEELRANLVAAARSGQPAPYARGIELLLAAIGLGDKDGERRERLLVALRELVDRFRESAERPEDLIDLLGQLEEPREEEPSCRPVGLDGFTAGVDRAFDPRRDTGSARVRVLAGIDGLDPAQPLAPLEVCVGLDRPVWRDLESQFVEWLMPGVGQLPEDSVIALETNPVFTDALLAGYNHQLLAELRWRNLRAATGCTPLRVFWERANTGTGARVDDIVGIAGWSDSSQLGAPSHRPGGAAARDLVVVVRGQLFLRYPRTLVYLVSALHGGVANFGLDPAAGATRLLPTFQGRIGTDVTFFGFQGLPAASVGDHWVVFEEPPAGFRFYNVGEVTVPSTANAAEFADLAFADPIRVLISGQDLSP